MTLHETIGLMTSPEYKERFKAEYIQLLIRYRRLDTMINELDNNTLNFTPTCPRQVLSKQRVIIRAYLKTLQVRALIEDIDLPEV